MKRASHLAPALALLLTAVGAACRAPAGADPSDAGSEWAALGAAWTFRSGKHRHPLEEGGAYEVTGGYVLFDGRERRLFGWEDVRASVELGASFSRLDLDVPFNGEEEADIWRVRLGGRLERDWPELSLTPWLHAGIYARTHGSEDLDVGPFDQDGRGIYAGLGVVHWTTPEVGIGPFVTFTRDVRTNDLRETFVGITLLVRGRPGFR